MKCCSTCGQPLPRVDGLVWNPDQRSVSFEGKSVRLSRGHARVFDALYRRPRGFVDQQELTDAVYADDPNGGPSSAYGMTGNYVLKLRELLEPIGWSINLSQTKPRIGHRLVKLPTTDEKQTSGRNP